jgi:hypothetical protein
VSVTVVPSSAGGPDRYEVRFAYDGNTRRRRFTTRHAAEQLDQALGDICRRWPLQPLVDLCELDDLVDFADRVGVRPASLPAAQRDGLSDTQADTWAVRAGFLPVEVWGWDWIDAGPAFAHLDPHDDEGAAA